MDLPFDIANASPFVQDHYRRMIADGQSPRFSEMCALGAAPAVHGTDDSWMHGRKNAEWLDALPKKQAQWMVREAKKAGISTEGKYYMGGIADKRAHLDPRAWVSDRSDVLKVAKERKLELKGQINYTPPEGVAPAQRRNSMNPRLVSQLAKKEMASDPGLTRKAAEMRVREKHSLSGWRKRA